MMGLLMTPGTPFLMISNIINAVVLYWFIWLTPQAKGWMNTEHYTQKGGRDPGARVTVDWQVTLHIN